MPGFSAAWRTSPKTSSATSASRKSPLRVARRRHPASAECEAAVTDLLEEGAVRAGGLLPPGLDREYTECYGFSLEDIFAFGLK